VKCFQQSQVSSTCDCCFLHVIGHFPNAVDFFGLLAALRVGILGMSLGGGSTPLVRTDIEI
jgi:hypothetical protein